MWFIGVEAEQETSAPLRKKNPGSAPAKGIKIHRKQMTSILKTFHHFNRSPADNNHRTRSYDLWGVTGNWSHALVT